MTTGVHNSICPVCKGPIQTIQTLSEWTYFCKRCVERFNPKGERLSAAPDDGYKAYGPQLDVKPLAVGMSWKNWIIDQMKKGRVSDPSALKAWSYIHTGAKKKSSK